MTVTLLNYTMSPEHVCGEAAAICTASADKDKSLHAALASGHESVLEHAVFTFQITGLSRAALAQLTRHRLASYSVQSQRYVRMHDVEPVLPKSILASPFKDEAEQLFHYSMDLYERMIEASIRAEDARFITMQCVPTSLVMTSNARELGHLFSLRCCNRAQWEIRQLADEMLKLCKLVAPTLFENAGPGCVRGHCPEERPCGSPRGIDDWNGG